MEGDLQAMRSSPRSLSSELGKELMAHLFSEDQNEVRVKYARNASQQLEQVIQNYFEQRSFYYIFCETA